jgi:hypothetical protein
MVGTSKVRSALPKNAANKTQSRAFIKVAQELGCDEDPAHFDEILKKVARHKPPLHVPPEPRKPKAKSRG